MKNKKLLALIASKASWQYYNKYKLYLRQLEHPFRHRIDFHYDLSMEITAAEISEYAAVAFFYHDPLKDLYPDVYAYAKRIEAICNEAGISFINRPDALSNTVKSIQLKLLSDAGFRVAKAFPFKQIDELKEVPNEVYPLFLRIDVGHDSHGEFVQGPFTNYRQMEEAYRVFELNGNKDLAEQVAIQFINTRKHDGLYCKYRCLATRHHAMKSYMYYSKEWYIHNNNSVQETWTHDANVAFRAKAFTSEEIVFFTKALKSLDLDFCAFDYAYTPNNDIVIWEANPHPAFLNMSDAEPLRSQIVELLNTYYESFLPPLHWHQKIKQNLRKLVR
ncbi:MAG: hypothetical protein FGM54_05070 [Chitinophagaceae bacterium]|nr:hypothetical protein [Chitinophagaceae bacterium]